jgi:Holliday junction resolvasome RuvABC ATP-dependent DNA helicase subunit
MFSQSFIGQAKVINRLRMWAVMGAGTNLILRGSAGSGKTTIAQWYAYSLNQEYYYHVCDGSHILPPSENVPVVLDEIHNLRPVEAWYQYPGVIVGCTTEAAELPEPFMTRFITVWLERYKLKELQQIAETAGVNPMVAKCIAKRSRGCPRTALIIARELVTYASFHRIIFGSAEEVNQVLDSLGIYEGGYNDHDLEYLSVLGELGVASLDTISSTLNLPKKLVQLEIEPFLLRQKRIKITSKGRCVS